MVLVTDRSFIELFSIGTAFGVFAVPEAQSDQTARLTKTGIRAFLSVSSCEGTARPVTCFPPGVIIQGGRPARSRQG
jgi:hypothetical protein